MKDLFLKSGSADFQLNNKAERTFSIGSFVLKWLTSKGIISTTDCCVYQLSRYVEDFEIGNLLPPYVIPQTKHLKGLNPIIQLITLTGQVVDLSAESISVTINLAGNITIGKSGSTVGYKIVII